MLPSAFKYVIAISTVSVTATTAFADEAADRIKMAHESEAISQVFDMEGFAFDIAQGPFEPKADSFEKHYFCPVWFRDAKFGIYSHWGLCTVPGFDGHYARFMYMQHEPQAYRDDQAVKRRFMSGYKPGRESVYEYHVRNFGHPSEFGYKDFAPMWKAEKFDAMKLAAPDTVNFAVIDSVKHKDLANDKHSSKNVVMPLTIPRRLQILNQEPITPDTREIRLRMVAEEGYDPQQDVAVASLRLGANEVVNFGKGSKALRTETSGKDLVVIFDGRGNGITEKNFAAKLPGRKKRGKLLVGYAKLTAIRYLP